MCISRQHAMCNQPQETARRTHALTAEKHFRSASFPIQRSDLSNKATGIPGLPCMKSILVWMP